MENLMISTPERRYHFEQTYTVGKTCWCDRPANWLVDDEPTCTTHMHETIDSTDTHQVRRMR